MTSFRELPLVHVRTPTYRRPLALRRCLETLQEQSWANWVCDIHDDDPDGSAAAVVRALGDPRIHYNQNRPPKRASANIDGCFTRANPHDAEYFFVLEDDNFLMPRFIEENIALCRREGVAIVLRNQLVEHDHGADAARLSTQGVLDGKFVERRYPPDLFRLSLIPDIGVSNGGLFWSREAVSNLEIGVRCSSTLQEYMRTYAIAEDVWVAMEPLAVWAENGAATTRNVEITDSWLRRELDLKRAVQVLRRNAWRRAGEDAQRKFLAGGAFAFPAAARASGLVKALIRAPVDASLAWHERLRLRLRGMLIRSAGRIDDGLVAFIASRGG